MKLTSKVEYEFTLKLNLAEATDLLELLAQNGGQSGKMCYLYDALVTEFRNFSVYESQK